MIDFPSATPLRVGGGRLPGALTTDGPIFRSAGQPWRWSGVSAFQLCDRFAKGEDIDPFLEAYRGFNTLRVWGYVPAADWGASAWDVPPSSTILNFLDFVHRSGWLVEWTLLTDDDPARIGPARALVDAFGAARPPNLVVEIANEPDTHKHVDTSALRDACQRSDLLFSSGNYEDSQKFFGTYLTDHTSRDNEWPRRAHDLFEFHNGGGPNAPSDPAHNVPCVADEPAKLEDVGFSVTDWRAYFGACSLLGAGATFHSETGKFARVPTDQERQLAAAALEGLTAFPADAPKAPYRRIDEQGRTLRTYAVGNSMVRIRPTTHDAPEPGWVPIDGDGILWRR